MTDFNFPMLALYVYLDLWGTIENKCSGLICFFDKRLLQRRRLVK